MNRPNGAVLFQLGRVFGRGTIAGLSEEGLLDRFVREGDEAAFAALVARHGPMVLGVCRRVLGNEHEVEDAFQATFLVFVRRARTIRDGGRLGPWLHGVAHRVAVRARANNAKKHRREPNVNDPDRFEIVVEQDDANDLRKVIDDELASLPESIRAPIVLCYLEGMTHEEAATRLGWPLGTVRSRMARGRDTLRRRLTRRGISVGDASLTSALVRPSLSVVTPLVNATVKSAMSFSNTGSASALVASATAVSLAKGVLHAMTLTKISTIGAVALSGVVAFGGWQSFGRPSQEPNKAQDAVISKTTGRVMILEDKLESMAAQIKALREENQRLQQRIQGTTALPNFPGSGESTVPGSAIPGTPLDDTNSGIPGGIVGAGGAGSPPQVGITDVRGADAKKGVDQRTKNRQGSGVMRGMGMPGVTKGGMSGMGGSAQGGMPGVTKGAMPGMPGMGGMPGMMGMGASGGRFAPSDPNEPTSERFDNMIFVASPSGNKVSIFDIDRQKATSLTLLDSTENHHTLMPVVRNQLVALQIQGPEIKKIGVYAYGNWYSQDLQEPTDFAQPIVNDDAVGYKIGNRVYAFSFAWLPESTLAVGPRGILNPAKGVGRWGVLELKEPDLTASFNFTRDYVEVAQKGHLYRFDKQTAKWNGIDIDPRTILDAPEDKPAKPEAPR